MNQKTMLNGAPIDVIYSAEIVEYTVGPVSYKSAYFLPSGRILPVKLKPKYGLRAITITLDFMGTPSEIAMHISTFTKNLQEKASLLLPDGFYYECEYDSCSVPKEKAPWIQQVKFSLSGYRHSAKETLRLSASGSVLVVGNMNAYPVIKLTPQSGATTVTFNGITIENVSGVVTIDSADTLLTDSEGNNIFRKSDLTEWPKLTPGKNTITFTGCSEVAISYYPIWL